MDINIIQMLLVALVSLGAGYTQSVAGFGFGIFSMIFYPSLLVYTEANLVSTFLAVLTSITVVIATRKNINYKNLVFPILGCLLSTWFAVMFIKSQENKTLMLLLGIALFVLSVYFFFFSSKIRIRPTWYAGLIAGALSGILSGMFAIGGPPVVIYFLQSERSSERYLATISAYFILSGLISVVMKVAAGFVTTTVLWAVLFGGVGMAIGAVVGKLTRDRTKPELITKAVYGIMAVSGVANIITSLI